MKSLARGVAESARKVAAKELIVYHKNGSIWAKRLMANCVPTGY